MKKNMLKPLIINRCYLFDQSPGGECLRTFVKSLNKDQYTPVIYASDRSPHVRDDGENVKLTKEYRIVRYLAAVVRRILIPDLTFLPGYEWYSWGIGAKRRILKDIQRGAEFDYLHSVSFPCASHKVALEIKKKTGLPWVMQLYDPWADNPYRPFKTTFFKDIDWKQERECVENADLIIHDNQQIADLWSHRYGADIAKKIVVLPLTIPLPNVQIIKKKQRCNEKLIISHIGNLMLNRTSQPFILAVSNLLNKYPEYRKKLIINYVGAVTQLDIELINYNGLNDIFNLIGSVSAEECVKYYEQSDIFLAIDGVNKDNLFFPSKILKYLFFRRPILGITPNGSVLDFELRQSGHVSVANTDLQSIEKYLEKAIIDYDSLLSFNYSYWQKFQPSNIVEQYTSMINRYLNIDKNETFNNR